MVVLKPLARAERDGDRIYAVIRGSAVNHNGASGGLTVPGGEAQEELIRSALAVGGVAASDVDYLEAHGTGTVLGDAVEVRAIARALGGGRQPDRPLLVGSVKTNIGHLEAAAGIAGLIKTALALRHGELPAHLHVSQPTNQVDWARLPVRITTSTTPWPATGGRPRVAGVSAFGFTGTNAHVVLSGPSAPASSSANGAGRPTPGVGPASRAGAIISGRAHLLVLSAAGGGALAAARDGFARALSAPADADIGDICYAAAARRAHLEHRLAVVGHGAAELVAGLSGGPTAHQGVAPGDAARLMIVYGDRVAVDWRALERDEPAFRGALDALDDGGVVRAALAANGAERGEPVAVLAIQLALAAVWEAYGLRPDAVAGRGVGELAAACAAGALDQAQAIRATLGGATVTVAPPVDSPAAPVLWLASVGGPLSGPHPLTARTPVFDWDALSASLAAAGEYELLAIAGGPDAAAVTAKRQPGLAAVGADLNRPEGILDAVAGLHVRGVDIHWETLFGRRPYRAVLPRYPWQRRRHWADAPGQAASPAPAGTPAAVVRTASVTTAPAATTAAAVPAVSAVAVSAVAREAVEVTSGGPVGAVLPDDVRDRCAARMFTVRWCHVSPPAADPVGRWLVVPLTGASVEAGRRVADALLLGGAEVTWQPSSAGSDRDRVAGASAAAVPEADAPWDKVPPDHGIVLVAAAVPGSVPGDVLAARVAGGPSAAHRAGRGTRAAARRHRRGAPADRLRGGRPGAGGGVGRRAGARDGGGARVGRSGRHRPARTRHRPGPGRCRAGPGRCRTRLGRRRRGRTGRGPDGAACARH